MNTKRILISSFCLICFATASHGKNDKEQQKQQQQPPQPAVIPQQKGRSQQPGGYNPGFQPQPGAQPQGHNHQQPQGGNPYSGHPSGNGPSKSQNGSSNGGHKSGSSVTGKSGREDSPHTQTKNNEGAATTTHTKDGTKTQTFVKKDGSKQKTTLNSKGKELSREEISNDGTKTIVQNQITRKGDTRSTETLKYNATGQEVSKTVTVKRPLDLAKNSAYKSNRPIENHYDRGKYGFVYRHGSQTNTYVNVFHSDTVVVNNFNYGWHWNSAWYTPDVFFFPVYTVYPTPTYWVTDWMVAGYLSDAYWTGPEPVNSGPQPAMNISPEIKEEIRVQVENTIKENASAEKEAEQTDGGTKQQGVNDSLIKALSEPGHIYPVSDTLSVTMTNGNTQKVTLTCGDLLKLEPGQGDFADANENTLVNMRVVVSKKNASDAATAGDLISVPLSSLQDFDSEFRSRLDQGLAEAVANKDLFKANH